MQLDLIAGDEALSDDPIEKRMKKRNHLLFFSDTQISPHLLLPTATHTLPFTT